MYPHFASGTPQVGTRPGWAIKRFVDVVAAAVALVLLGPIMVIVSAAIFLRMGRPILLKQQRPGRREVPFTLVKFRTMRDDHDSAGRLLPDAERITGLGAFLRKTSIDELPELFNVLRGDMSLVGPRPLLMRYLPHYTLRERRRHEVRPGVTGLAQINGRNHLGWDQRLELDISYVENWTLGLDAKILARTVLLVLTRKDIAVDANTVMRDLDDERTERKTRRK